MSHMLIIDDDADIRLLVTVLLESAGHTAAEASGGEEGLAYLAEHAVDGVLLDINMPYMSGWEVCYRIKTEQTTAHIPVIMFTVRSAVLDSEELARAKPDGFLVKPFTKPELLSVIAQAMGYATLPT